MSAYAYPGHLFCHVVYLGMGVFRAESSDLSHMGVYMGMGIISVWPLLRANMVVKGAKSVSCRLDGRVNRCFAFYLHY